MPNDTKFIGHERGAPVHQSQAEAMASLDDAAVNVRQATETAEPGAIYTVEGPPVPGKAPDTVDIRFMGGQSKGGAYKGPRVKVSTGGKNEQRLTTGEKFRSNETKNDRQRLSHIHGMTN